MVKAKKTLDDMANVKTHPMFYQDRKNDSDQKDDEQVKEIRPEQLYEELDFRLALTHGHLEKVKKLPAKGFGRKGMNDYL